MNRDKNIEKAIRDDMAKLYPGHVITVRYVDLNRYEAQATVFKTFLDLGGNAVRQN